MFSVKIMTDTLTDEKIKKLKEEGYIIGEIDHVETGLGLNTIDWEAVSNQKNFYIPVSKNCDGGTVLLNEQKVKDKLSEIIEE